MDDYNEISKQCFTKDVTEEGKTVTIYVRSIDIGEWELSLIGKSNQSTTWSEWFPTVKEAMDEGLSAIRKEGIDEFYSNPEFAYLGDLQA